jgi:hypothetical protein
MANALTFHQLATVLTDITQQATGQKVLTPTTTADFVTVAQKALLSGYDPLLNAISQVLSRTIFSERPYTRKFQGLEADSIRYGNHVRKLQVADKAWEEDDRVKLVDGQSIDQQVVDKPNVLQTNFYGEEVYQKHITIFRDQLDVAFSSPEEFQRFISMIMQNVSDMIEQAHESTARATIANLVAGTIQGGQTSQVVYLKDEYAAQAGFGSTAFNPFDPQIFPDFARWCFARMQIASKAMTERTINYHVALTDYDIPRHTPVNMQKCFLYAPLFEQIDARVVSTTFNTEYLRLLDKEDVNFWQSSKTPGTIATTPAYISAAAALTTGTAGTYENVVGVLMDQEAAGYTVVNQWSAPAPFNARGGYTNMFWHFTDRYWNDFTENAVIFMLENPANSGT